SVKVDLEGRLLVGGLATDQEWPLQTPYGFVYFRRPVVARLLADGSLDPSFGDHGAVRLPVRCESKTALEVDADGRVVVAGGFLSTAAKDFSGPWYLAARLTADGSLDASYSDDGFVDA